MHGHGDDVRVRVQEKFLAQNHAHDRPAGLEKNELFVFFDEFGAAAHLCNKTYGFRFVCPPIVRSPVHIEENRCVTSLVFVGLYLSPAKSQIKQPATDIGQPAILSY